jgi:hypothetical protein
VRATSAGESIGRMSSQTLARSALVIQDECETTVDLAGRHAPSSLDDLDLDELQSAAV